MGLSKEQIEKRLSHPDIEQQMERMAFDPLRQFPLADVIVRAEYLERKNQRGYVVLWLKVHLKRFVAIPYEEYDDDDPTHGDIHWQTSLCGRAEKGAGDEVD